MKATAVAPANIAFIKYWGKADPQTRIPQNNSISMNLSKLYTTTTVEFMPSLNKDEIFFVGEKVVQEKEIQRIVWSLDKIRQKTNVHNFAKVVTKNTFPKATGIASSASGFASLATASFGALGFTLTEKELSIFCRQLSGTACRSIPSGFVEWEKGSKHEDSYAYQLYKPEYWDICDIVAIVTKTMKKVGSTEGHKLANTSPFYMSRTKGMNKKITDIKAFMHAKNFTKFGILIENESLNMHAICLTSTPPLIYWESITLAIIKSIQQWREEKIVESYFTIDAGPSVHVICEGKNVDKITSLLSVVSGIQSIVVNRPAEGAHLINSHLF